MEKSSELFFRLPFILYPENIPKSKYGAIEKAAIILFAFDEMKKGAFFKKGERLRTLKKIHLAIPLYYFKNRGLLLSNYLINEPLYINNYPSKMPNLEIELDISSYEDYSNSLNKIYILINSLETKKEVVENFPTIKLVEDLEYLLFYPGMSQNLIEDFNLIGIDNLLSNSLVEDKIEHYKRLKSFLSSMRRYLKNKPNKIINSTKHLILESLEENKRNIYQEYETSLYALKKEINVKIDKLEIQNSKDIKLLRKEYLKKKETIMLSSNKMLKAAIEPIQKLTLPDYDPIKFTGIDDYFKVRSENLQKQNQIWEKYQKENQEIISAYNLTIEEENKRVEEINFKFNSEVIKENQRFVMKELERDNKIMEVEEREKILENLIKGINSTLYTKNLEMNLIQNKLNMISINLENHPLKENFLKNKMNIIGLPFYLIQYESLEETRENRYLVIPPLNFPDFINGKNRWNLDLKNKLEVYGAHSDQDSPHIAFNIVSRHFDTIANNLLDNILYFKKKIYQKPTLFLFKQSEINQISEEKNLLLDPLFETGVYNGIDWMNETDNALLKTVGIKTRNTIIHFFDELNELILKQRGQKRNESSRN